MENAVFHKRAWVIFLVVAMVPDVSHSHGDEKPALFDVNPEKGHKPDPAAQSAPTERPVGPPLEDALIVGVKNLYRNYNTQRLFSLSEPEKGQLYEQAVSQLNEDWERGTTNLAEDLQLTDLQQFRIQRDVKAFGDRSERLIQWGASSPFITNRMDKIVSLYRDVSARFSRKPGNVAGVSGTSLRRGEKLLAKEVFPLPAFEGCEMETKTYKATPKGVRESFLQALAKGDRKQLESLASCKVFVSQTTTGSAVYRDPRWVVTESLGQMRSVQWTRPGHEENGKYFMESNSGDQTLIFQSTGRRWYWSGHLVHPAQGK